MNTIAVAVFAAAGALAAGAAQAHVDVAWSVTIGGGAPVYAPPMYAPPVYAPPVYAPRVYAPVVVTAPAPYVVAPVVVPAPRVYVPSPVIAVPARAAYPVRFDAYRGHRGWDRDHDGVPNRYDRYDRNPRRW